MRTFPPDAMSGAYVEKGQRDLSDLYASSDREPPAPLGMFIRLVVLLAIALGFGLAAHLLVGMPH